MDCTDRIATLSPLVGRTLVTLGDVEVAAAELQACSRGKDFRVRAELSWNGWRAMHRGLLEDAGALVEAFSEGLELRHDRTWAEWRRLVLSRDLVFESALSAAMDEDDLDKHRIHRRWKSPRVDEVRNAVLQRIFGTDETPVSLRDQVERHRTLLQGLLARSRKRRVSVPQAPTGNAGELATAEIRAALMLLARTFSDVSLLTYGFVRGYPDVRSRSGIEDEAQGIVDAILLGERAFGKVSASDMRRRAQRKAYYAGLHQMHDDAGASTPFCFNDAEVEQQLAYAAG